MNDARNEEQISAFMDGRRLNASIFTWEINVGRKSMKTDRLFVFCRVREHELNFVWTKNVLM